MPKITIDGQEVEAEAGTTVIRAARDAGIHIPHYCWHPRLSVAGNCRMCLVEVEGVPKLLTSCTTEIRDGMVVNTKNDTVKQAQRGVLEFLLLNHPLDCPICDKAGECKLQDQYFKYSAEDSRLETRKVHKPKNLDIGKHIVLDQERCVLCTRCVRFMDEVAHEPVLGIIERGDTSKLTVFPEKGLNNRYSLNTTDICPVGALTSKEFRFKKRVWFLNHEQSVCPNCSTGCPVILDHEDRKLYRMMPGQKDGEQAWLCDPGRLGFGFVHENDRPRAPLMRNSDGKLEPRTWEAAIKDVTRQMSDFVSKFGKNAVAGIYSNWSSNEEIFAFTHLITQTLGANLITSHNPRIGLVNSGPADELQIKEDKCPNSRGADVIGKSRPGGLSDFHQIIQDAHAGKIKAMWILDPDFMGRIPDKSGQKRIREALKKVKFLVIQAPLEREANSLANAILPCGTWAESEGTFVNEEGRIQYFKAAFPPVGQGKPSLEIIRLAATATGKPLPYATPYDTFRTLAGVVPEFKGLDYSDLMPEGALLGSGQTVAVPVTESAEDAVASPA